MLTSFLPLVAVNLMFAALALTTVALITENAITNQMARSRYRFISLFRVTRRAPFLASVAIAGFSSYVIQALPNGAGYMALLMSVLIGLIAQTRAVVDGKWPDVVRYAVNPWIAVGMASALCVQNAKIGVPALIMAVLLWVQSVVIRRYRTEQDLISLQD